MILLCKVCREVLDSNSAEFNSHFCGPSLNTEVNTTSVKCKHCGSSIYWNVVNSAWVHFASLARRCATAQYTHAEPLEQEEEKNPVADSVDSRAWQ